MMFMNPLYRSCNRDFPPPFSFYEYGRIILSFFFVRSFFLFLSFDRERYNSDFSAVEHQSSLSLCRRQAEYVSNFR